MAIFGVHGETKQRSTSELLKADEKQGSFMDTTTSICQDYALCTDHWSVIFVDSKYESVREREREIEREQGETERDELVLVA